MIQALDGRLNQNQGLRELKGGRLNKADENSISDKEPTLVLIHGTFSKTKAFLEELNSIQDGRDFLHRGSSCFGSAFKSCKKLTLTKNRNLSQQ